MSRGTPGRSRATRHALALVAGLAACDDAPKPDGLTAEDPLCAGNVWHHDADGDGWGSSSVTDTRTGCIAPDRAWVREPGDCDDADATVHPGGPETPYDGVDGDCDPATPDDDLDGDGHAHPADCDDADAHVFPGAPERCDGVDDDCDGVRPPDEADADLDGAPACADCADDDARRHPGADEACDGIDDDCDGAIDDLDADGDGFPGCPGTPGRVDVLLLVDGRSSAATVRARAAVELPGVLARLRASGRDWRVLAVTSDLGVPLADVGPGDADAVLAAAVGGAVQAGPSRPLDVAVDLVLSATLRPGAAPAVWVLAADDDGSATTLADAVARLGTPDGRLGVGVIGAGFASCRVPDRSGRPTPRLAAFADLAGGARVSPCVDGWADALARALPAVAPVDCDDADPARHPGAVERCDGLDDDCDGGIDDDDDRDGVTVCAGDCDDHDATVRPRAPERCDGVDGDCDGLVPADEADPDHDGWRACGGDCDETDPAVHPHAVDRCGDGVDGDCVGGDPAPGADRDRDGWTSCALVPDCDDDDDTVFPGAPEHRFDGVDDDCDGLVDGADDDVAEPVSLGAALARYTLTSTAPLFHWCGTDWRSVAVTSTGLVLPGAATWNSTLVDVDTLRAHAPIATAGWAALDPSAWTGGRFLRDHDGGAAIWVIRRATGLAVVFDHVPYADGDGFLTSVLTLGDLPSLALLEGRDGAGDTAVGYACTASGPTHGIAFDAAPACLRPGTWDAEVALLDGSAPSPPFAATAACLP